MLAERCRFSLLVKIQQLVISDFLYEKKKYYGIGPWSMYIYIYIYVVHSVCDDVSIITLSMITMINRDSGIVDAVQVYKIDDMLH